MKIHYKKICFGILTKVKEEKLDERDLIREWVKFFEDFKTPGWNRDEFLDCMVECKKQFEKNSKRFIKDKILIKLGKNTENGKV